MSGEGVKDENGMDLIEVDLSNVGKRIMDLFYVRKGLREFHVGFEFDFQPFSYDQ